MKFKADQTSQKLRGGYYTPQNLADFVTSWVISKEQTKVLEPSCGDGVFFQALSNNRIHNDVDVSAFELFDTEAMASRERCHSLGLNNVEITEGDFLTWFNANYDEHETFTGVLGNPPFIRYQFLEPEFQAQAELVFRQLNLRFTKHTNAWVPFILASIKLLESGGRLGMVIPSEIIHVMHAQSLRSYLGEVCRKIVIIDPQEIWFEDTLQGAVIILAEKKLDAGVHSEGVAIVSVAGTGFLDEDPNTLFDQAIGINGQTVIGKWTKALLSHEELQLLQQFTNHPHVHRFTDIATVDVGIVTGANDFFLVPDEIVEQYQLHDYVQPMFGRSQHCQGVVYDQNQHGANAENGLPTNFVYIKGDKKDLPKSVQKYVEYGEEQKLHTRYKCSVRKPWYTVPSVYATQLGMLKRAHDAPRLIFNELEALTTDTAYRIRTSQFTPQQLSFSFLNPLTTLYAELEGRSYGGGVLELVPSEIEKLYIPVAENIEFDLEHFDNLVRTHSMAEILTIQGELIFGALGFNREQIQSLLNIWLRLKNRRQRRD